MWESLIVLHDYHNDVSAVASKNFLSCEEKFVDIQLWNITSYDDCCSISSLHWNECA
jgi:hypothetical protein